MHTKNMTFPSSKKNLSCFCARWAVSSNMSSVSEIVETSSNSAVVFSAPAGITDEFFFMADNGQQRFVTVFRTDIGRQVDARSSD